ncbi:uncharacterized protein TNCV_2227111 [Trichonephila clavipes]|uniref:Uncharacterized protein n=1 Tax=Trichonephila clavipes TaxID=2585209 RepID=A0A8X6WEA6_TRICX|nr:uncharacterized protein TNCV_2227111 [Trichonephila clavipes]
MSQDCALTGDIENMFRQILVNEDDVEFQRIFWREIPEESTIQQLAEEEIIKFPEAYKVALEDFYVDDLITGTNSKEDAKKLVSQVIELMKKGGFPIRKWASNESSVLESLPTELRSSSGSAHRRGSFDENLGNHMEFQGRHIQNQHKSTK